MAEVQTEQASTETEHLDHLYPDLPAKEIKNSHAMYRTGLCLASFEKVCCDCYKVLRYKEGDSSINLLLPSEGYPHVCRDCMKERISQIKKSESV